MVVEVVVVDVAGGDGQGNRITLCDCSFAASLRAWELLGRTLGVSVTARLTIQPEGYHLSERFRYIHSCITTKLLSPDGPSHTQSFYAH